MTLAKPKQRTIPTGGNSQIGYWAEETVAHRLEAEGLKVERQYNQAPFDLLVNGQMVDVKFASKPYAPPSTTTTSPLWRFEVNRETKNRKTKCDFFALLTGKGDLFIVPERLVGKSTSLKFVYPTQHLNVYQNNWQSFLNRFDLLKGA